MLHLIFLFSVVRGYVFTHMIVLGIQKRCPWFRESNPLITSIPLSLRTAALQALKRKKRYENQLTQIDGTLSTIEFQREALENANTNTEVLKNMGFAAKAMKAAHENMDIDKVDDLMQDITEQQELAQEISDAISKPVGFGEEFDEDELLAELDELEQEELDKNLLEIGGTEDSHLPNVPSTSLPSRPAKEDEDEDDMDDLQRWAMEAM
uniref:Charged multivesicular body protein 4b n=1 Tax=Oncorhynchus tshawytscha TaxID=74940 RepID=A0AAZ3SX23_ONCTS